MQVSNGEIFNAKDALQKVLDQKFPVMVSYKLAHLAKKLNEELPILEEVRIGLVKKYGTPDEDNPQNISVKPGSEGFAKFVVEYNELMGQKVEMVFEKVKLPEKVAATCDACHHNMDKQLEIEPSLLMALEPFVTVGD